MNVNELDLSEIGSWPKPAKAIFIGFVCIVVAAIFYYVEISSNLDQLFAEQKKEEELKHTFEGKQRMAANLEAYRSQMLQLEATFSQFLKQLPTEDETAGLLDDINFVGTASGLDFRVIQWQAPQEKEFYIELPIDIEVIGDYHQLGTFVSDVAALPRIVTLHNFDIKAADNNKLIMKLQAKTYRYKEDGNAKKKKG
ncbi:type 4a pilus biogenesis protein PilO [Gallaecimonas xiamenensis]|uniref:Pilus assembly protein, PilO n=1 Tax=Gallaecimonas xiamenensis 3-C-1 TaxID=745411 RepID=K2K2J6_9GAMM|nr:type 4a pilus biogenesis protein PilO [Gallaecimonas xiamenensis]EKE77089.1 pilus assembly protein, PilO [Gallaecimonas xiamenensis 3-C-1]